MTIPNNDDAGLTITAKGERWRTSDNPLNPGQMLTLELIARFPGLNTDQLRDIYFALLRKMSVDDALIYVKSGELERESK